MSLLRRFRPSGAFCPVGTHPMAPRVAIPIAAAVRTFSADAAEDVLALNKQLLASISRMDFPAYAELMADDISCFEPEAGHQQVRAPRAAQSPSLLRCMHSSKYRAQVVQSFASLPHH